LKRTLIALSTALVLPSSVWAQQVPALEPAPAPASAVMAPGSPERTLPPPPVNLLSGREAPLNAKERHGVRLANQWKDRRDLPARGADGSVMFLYGATLPSVVCAPLRTCNLRLQPGEVVTQLDLGDPVRWKAVPAVSGSGDDATTTVVIKPSDSGLETSMTISTDRRLYVVQLVSRTRDWMPVVSFSYPEEAQAAWAAYATDQQRRREATVLPDGLNAAALDFGFRIAGDSPAWRPVRVYSDGVRTYIQFPPAMRHDEAPALVALGGDDREQLVNYRLSGDRYVVDKVLRRAALISGVGSAQTKVEILRDARVP
jgi:P-type conjugative transfer protein TrbG